eukprot:scaffold44001_cov37-Cyclotella_meneghiniana.AAC.2
MDSERATEGRASATGCDDQSRRIQASRTAVPHTSGTISATSHQSQPIPHPKQEHTRKMMSMSFYVFQCVTIQFVATANKERTRQPQDNGVVQRDEYKMQQHTTSHDETSWFTRSSSMFCAIVSIS